MQLILLLSNAAVLWAAEMTYPSSSNSETSRSSSSSFWDISSMWSYFRRRPPVAVAPTIETYSTELHDDSLEMSFNLITVKRAEDQVPDAEQLAVEGVTTQSLVETISTSADEPQVPVAPPTSSWFSNWRQSPPSLPVTPSPPADYEEEKSSKPVKVDPRREQSKVLVREISEVAKLRSRRLGLVDEELETDKSLLQSTMVKEPPTVIKTYTEREVRANLMRARSCYPLIRSQMGVGKGDLHAELTRRVSERNLQRKPETWESETTVPEHKTPLARQSSKPSISRTLSRNHLTENTVEGSIFLDIMAEALRRRKRRKQMLLEQQQQLESSAELITDTQTTTTEDEGMMAQVTNEMSDLSIVSQQQQPSPKRLKGRRRMEEKQQKKKNKVAVKEITTQEMDVSSVDSKPVSKKKLKQQQRKKKGKKHAVKVMTANRKGNDSQ